VSATAATMSLLKRKAQCMIVLNCNIGFNGYSQQTAGAIDKRKDTWK
jgi:hypothetical protein